MSVVNLSDAANETMSSVHGVIQAGGFGTRLLPATKLVPKPMLEINGVPMVERMLRRMVAAGVMRVTVITGWHGEQIQEHLTSLDVSDSLQLDFLVESEKRGNIGSLRDVDCVSPMLLFAFGDLVTELDFTALVALHQESGDDVTLTTHTEEYRLQLGETVVDGDRVIGYKEKPIKEFLICSGIAIFNAAVPELIDPMSAAGISDLVTAALNAGLRVGHWTHGAFWIDVNSPELLLEANAGVKAREDVGV